MGYDLFLFCLTAAGILTVAIFSYKIARSRVYPIDIVRRISTPRTVDEEENYAFERFALLAEGCSDTEQIAQHFGVSENTVRLLVSQKSLKPKSVVIKTRSYGGERIEWGRRGWHYSQLSLPSQDHPSAEHDASLEKKVAELGRTVEEQEKRIRQLEVQSVQSALEPQESDADKLQAAENQTIH